MTKIVVELTKSGEIGQDFRLNNGSPPDREEQSVSHLIETIVNYCVKVGKTPSWHANCKARDRDY